MMEGKYKRNKKQGGFVFCVHLHEHDNDKMATSN